jgi:hypothetical protein
MRTGQSITEFAASFWCVCGYHGAGDIGKDGFWWGTWHSMFWTCHCDVVLGSGEEGVTWNSLGNSATRN